MKSSLACETRLLATVCEGEAHGSVIAIVPLSVHPIVNLLHSGTVA